MSIKIFFCYAREDEVLLKKLKTHLKPLQRQGYIDVWHDRDITAGVKWEQEIDKHLNNAHIILLLVSPDFIASDYCYDKEMKCALERHESGKARVIPVILRPVYWQGAPFGKLQTLPTDGKPVKNWQNEDEAFLYVVEGIHKVTEELTPKSSTIPIIPLLQQVEECNVVSSAVSSLPPIQPVKLALERFIPLSEPGAFTFFHAFTKLSGYMTSLAISHDGHTLIGGSTDHTIKVWDLQARQLLGILKGHSAGVTNIAIRSDGLTLVSGSPNGIFNEWDLRTGLLKNALEISSIWIDSIAMSSDGQTIASGNYTQAISKGHYTIKSYNLSLNQQFCEKFTFSTFCEGNDYLAISSDGHFLAHSAYQNVNHNKFIKNFECIKVWDLQTGQEHGTFMRDTLPRKVTRAITIYLDEQTLVSGSCDGTITVWDLHTQQQIRTLNGYIGKITSLAISSDGQVLASGGSDGTIIVWKLHTGQQLSILTGHSESITSLAFSSDGQMIASGSSDRTVRLWKMQ